MLNFLKKTKDAILGNAESLYVDSQRVTVLATKILLHNSWVVPVKIVHNGSGTLFSKEWSNVFIPAAASWSLATKIWKDRVFVKILGVEVEAKVVGENVKVRCFYQQMETEYVENIVSSVLTAIIRS